MVRIFTLILNEFSFSRRPIEVSMVFGLHDGEPIEYGAQREKDLPEYASVGAETLVSPEGQLQLLKMCRDADSGRKTPEEVPLRCREGDGGTKDTDCLIRGQTEPGLCRPHARMEALGYYGPDDMLCQTGRYCFIEEFARYW